MSRQSNPATGEWNPVALSVRLPQVETAIVVKLCNEHNAALDAAITEATKPLADALQMLHDDMADYARINHLGGFDNHVMRNAREQLAKVGSK